MADSVQTAELRRTWESAAPGWARWEETFSEGLIEVTDALLDMAGIEPGMRVIDLACGAGSQSLRAAYRVGPSGCVVAADISGAMLEYLRENVWRAGLNNIRVLECAAEDLDGADAPYDAGISRLGLMLFLSPSRALIEVQHVLRPGARFAALVFTTPADNPFMALPMQILLRRARKESPAPGQPGIFALGRKGALEDLMADSGLVNVQTRIVRAPLRLSSATEALQMIQQAFGAYRAVVADLSEESKAEAWAEVTDCLKEFETSSGFATELQFAICAGAKTG